VCPAGSGVEDRTPAHRGISAMGAPAAGTFRTTCGHAVGTAEYLEMPTEATVRRFRSVNCPQRAFHALEATDRGSEGEGFESLRAREIPAGQRPLSRFHSGSRARGTRRVLRNSPSLCRHRMTFGSGPTSPEGRTCPPRRLGAWLATTILPHRRSLAGFRFLVSAGLDAQPETLAAPKGGTSP
jgi:hypothetical protein